ncbi:MAG: DUF5723 family protein [Muribaculum sp.]|nr:DUF5723 family protein [Muribaculum sp.]
MNIINKKFLSIILASASVATTAAQESATGYFLENYSMRWQMNPAMGNRLGYVGFPGLGNLNVGVSGNFNVTDIVYPYNGKTVLFTNPNIPASEVLGNLKNVNRLSQDSKVNLLQVGFKAMGGYNNIAISVKENTTADIPKSIFSLLKEGVSNKDYDINDLHVKANAYAEIALNHSRDIKQIPGLRAGVSFKMLMPVAYCEANFNNLHLDLQQDNWSAIADAEMKLGMNGLRYKTKENDRTGHRYVSGVDGDDIGFGFNGFGFAFDLGATYEWKDFVFSLALTDLGMINYNSVQLASTNGKQEFHTDNHIIGVGDGGDSWDDLVDDLSRLYELNDMGTQSVNSGLEGTLRVGADYKFPMYDKLHFGLLNTTHFNTIVPSTEFRLSANVEPVKGVAVAVSGAAGTFGVNYGFLLSLGNKGFNFNLGMDYAAFKMDKNHIPLDSNFDIHFGMNFPF